MQLSQAKVYKKRTFAFLQWSLRMNRAYSFIEIKSIDEDQRIIEGIASTPSADRVGDVVLSEGAKFKITAALSLATQIKRTHWPCNQCGSY